MDDPAAEPLARRYWLPPEHVPVLADPGDARYQACNGLSSALLSPAGLLAVSGARG